MQLLHGLVGHLHHSSKLRSEQLRIAFREEAILVGVQDLTDGFGPRETNVHHLFQCRPLHVAIHQLLGLVVAPPVVGGNDLELGPPGQ